MSTQALEIPIIQDGNRVIISLDDALKLRSKIRGMKRAAASIQENARRIQESAKQDIKWCSEFEQVLNLIIRTDEPL